MANCSDFVGNPLNEGFRIATLIIGFVVFIVGFIGNDLLLIVLFKRRQEMRLLGTFIGNLAVADLAVLCSVMPYFLVDLLQGRHPVVNQLHCSVNAVVLTVSYGVSVLSLVLISFHRYIKVCRRPLFHTLFTPTRNWAMCLALWVLVVLFNVPVFVGLTASYGYDVRNHMCTARAGRPQPHYSGVATIFLMLTSVLLIVFFNAAIFTRWYGSRRKLKDRKSRRQRMKVAKATWKSFLSMSLNNIATLEESDLDGLSVRHMGGLAGQAFRGSECLSDLSATSTAMGTAYESEVELRELVRQQPAMSGQVVKLRIAPRTSPTAAAPSLAACDIDSAKTGCALRKKPTPAMRVRMRRESLLYKALDLNTVCPIQNIPITANASSDNDVSELSCGQEEKGPSVCKLTAVDLTERNELEEAGRNSIPLCLHPSRAVRGHKQKSLYPSINRGRQFLSWRRKTVHYAKSPSSKLPLVRSLLIITACLFVLYMPYILTVILTYVLQDDMPSEVHVTTTLLLFVNCAINWLVYGVMNTTLRQAYVTTLNECARCCSSFPHRDAAFAPKAGSVSHHTNQ